MEKVKCFIIDDEPLAIDVVKSHLGKLDSFEIIGTDTDAVNAFITLKTKEVDLLFIDIEMPNFSGLEFIQSLKIKPCIIITTAFRDYAVQGFDLNILDYLVKPIPFDRFMKAIDKYLDQKRPLNEPALTKKEYVMVRADRKFIKVAYQDILYVEGLKDYVKIVLTGNSILTKQSIGNFEKELDSNAFIRIHKSYLVSLDKITAYNNHDVEIGKVELPIGKHYRNQLLSVLNNER